MLLVFLANRQNLLGVPQRFHLTQRCLGYVLLLRQYAPMALFRVLLYLLLRRAGLPLHAIDSADRYRQRHLMGAESLHAKTHNGRDYAPAALEYSRREQFYQAGAKHRYNMFL